MSLTILKAILVCGIIGHAINMYCDRLLSIFPNGIVSPLYIGNSIRIFMPDHRSINFVLTIFPKTP